MPAEPDTVVAGVDGGNSKTDVVLASTTGAVLARVRGPGCQPHRTGMPATVRMIRELVDAARARAGTGPGPLAAAACYLSNVDIPEEEDDARGRLTAAGIAGTLVVGNDVFAILRAGSRRGWGVAVVAGAGVNAAAVAPDGRTARFLAFGDLTGDWGGGDSLGGEALGAAVRAADGRGPDTSLRRAVPLHVGLAEPEAVAIALHRGELPRTAIRDLATVVLAEADAGDPVALGIVEHQAREVAVMAAALLRRLDLLDTGTDVVLGGGVLQAGNRTLDGRIGAELGTRAPRAVPLVLSGPPVLGAVLAALDTLPADPAAADHLRTALA